MPVSDDTTVGSETGGSERNVGEGDAQRALDAASSEPRTLARTESQDQASGMDEQATADQAAARRGDSGKG
jgi:hypothetical protein